MERTLIILAVMAATALVATWWSRRDGRVDTTAKPTGDAADLRSRISADGPTTPFALVEFTAPDCVPCRTTATLLDELVADRPTVSVHALDVADALDLARAHQVMRAPTTLLIDEHGTVLGRSSGVPDRADLTTLLDSVGAARAPQTTQTH